MATGRDNSSIPHSIAPEPQPLPAHPDLADTGRSWLAPIVVCGLVGLSVAGGVAWHTSGEQANLAASRDKPKVISVGGDALDGAFRLQPQSLVTDRSITVNALLMPERERRRLMQDLKSGAIRIAAVTLWDTYDEDEDKVVIDAAGYTQQFVITHKQKTYLIPVVPGGTVKISAVADGGGGGVTLGVKSVLGDVSLPPLAPGQVLEVPAL